jgi:hypothetical protein
MEKEACSSHVQRAKEAPGPEPGADSVKTIAVVGGIEAAGSSGCRQTEAGVDAAAKLLQMQALRLADAVAGLRMKGRGAHEVSGCVTKRATTSP